MKPLIQPRFTYTSLTKGLYFSLAMIFLMAGFFIIPNAQAKTWSGLENSKKLTDARNFISVKSPENKEELVEGAEQFIRNVADRGMNFLTNEDLTLQERKRKFRQILIDSFDINTIARFSLGRYWRKATPDQREEYLQLFKDMIIAVYSNRFDEYSGQQLKVKNSRPEGERDVLVSTEIISPGETSDVVVRWRIRYQDGQYKIIDVIIEGVSMLVTQRSDFSSVIQRGGGRVEVLLDHMRERVNSEKAQ